MPDCLSWLINIWSPTTNPYSRQKKTWDIWRYPACVDGLHTSGCIHTPAAQLYTWNIHEYSLFFGTIGNSQHIQKFFPWLSCSGSAAGGSASGLRKNIYVGRFDQHGGFNPPKWSFVLWFSMVQHGLKCLSCMQDELTYMIPEIISVMIQVVHVQEGGQPANVWKVKMCQ